MKTPVITNAETVKIVRVLLDTIEDMRTAQDTSGEVTWLREQYDAVLRSLAALDQRLSDLEIRFDQHELQDLEGAPLSGQQDKAAGPRREPAKS